MKARNYYEEINTALISYEEFKPYHTKSLEWIADRIDWCWRFRKITKAQMKELADRVVIVYQNF